MSKISPQGLLSDARRPNMVYDAGYWLPDDVVKTLMLAREALATASENATGDDPVWNKGGDGYIAFRRIIRTLEKYT